MLIKKPNIIFVIFFLILFNCLFSGIDLLKGTYSILKDQYKNLSILNGVIADE
ncbi:hypothetical protein GF322_04685, partial [Candidatus Dependentiae bacterium]|nr:hypothetical protein [Candidatus Dependentiae bacterium]